MQFYAYAVKNLSLLLPHPLDGQHPQRPAGYEQQCDPQCQVAVIAGRWRVLVICNGGDLYRSFFVAADLAFFMLFAGNAYPGLFGDNQTKVCSVSSFLSPQEVQACQ